MSSIGYCNSVCKLNIYKNTAWIKGKSWDITLGYNTLSLHIAKSEYVTFVTRNRFLVFHMKSI